MDRLRRVVWSKGMFLTPQHFQTQDRFAAESVHFRFAQSCFSNWGVSELAIDEASLVNGKLTVTKGSGIMPDGLVFDFPGSDQTPDSRQFKEFFSTNLDALEVFLTVPEERPRARNFTALVPVEPGRPEAEVSTRYAAETIDEIDETHGEEAKPVQVARKNFRIMFTGQAMDGCSVIKIARVLRSEQNRFVLDKEYVPPCLDLAVSNFLFELGRRLVEILRSKSSALSAGRRERGKTLADFSTSDVASFWLLHTVNSALPELDHVWRVRHGHPEFLYLALLRLAGALSTFAVDSEENRLPDYDHENLGPCFKQLETRLLGLLDTVIPSKCVAISLRRNANDPTVWSGQVTSDQHFQGSQFFLAAAANNAVSSETLITDVPNRVLIAAPDFIQSRIQFALSGIKLRHVAQPPPAVTHKFGSLYFSLSQSGLEWDNIVNARSISVHIPREFTDVRPEIYILLP